MIRAVTFKAYDFIHSSTQIVLDELVESLRIRLQNVHTLRFCDRVGNSAWREYRNYFLGSKHHIQTAAEITTRCPRFLKAGWFEGTQAFECGKGSHISGDSGQRVEEKGESPGGRFIDRKCFLGMILATRQVIDI